MTTEIRRRLWTSTGPRPCKLCKVPISAGDEWVSGSGVARACISCVPDVDERIRRQQAEHDRQQAESRLARKLDHRRAVQLATLQGDVLR